MQDLVRLIVSNLFFLTVEVFDKVNTRISATKFLGTKNLKDNLTFGQSNEVIDEILCSKNLFFINGSNE